VRRQQQRSAACQTLFDRLQRRQHQHVRIEVDHGLPCMLPAQPAEHVGLDRGVELENVVAEDEGVEIGQIQLLYAYPVEQRAGQVRIVQAAVGQADVAAAVGMLLRQRLHQGQRIGDVVARDDGEEDHERRQQQCGRAG